MNTHKNISHLIYRIYTGSIKKEEYMKASEQMKILIYCSMNKQYVEEIQK